MVYVDHVEDLVRVAEHASACTYADPEEAIVQRIEAWTASSAHWRDCVVSRIESLV